jgi:DNA-binding FrmR family transcriptional regulator
MKLASKVLLVEGAAWLRSAALIDTPMGMSAVGVMQLDENASGDLIRRLRRIECQVRGIIRIIEDNRDCAEIVTQLAAASRAIDRAGFRLPSSSLRQCLSATPNGQTEPMTSEQLERLLEPCLSVGQRQAQTRYPVTTGR